MDLSASDLIAEIADLDRRTAEAANWLRELQREVAAAAAAGSDVEQLEWRAEALREGVSLLTAKRESLQRRLRGKA